MAKIKYTKNELKRQKDSLKRFTRYLPTLILKKQQLQIEIVKIQAFMEEVEEKNRVFTESVNKWVDVFAEEMHIEELVSVKTVRVGDGNIAGIDIPIFEAVEFEEKEYDLIKTPLWVDYGVDAVKERITLKIQLEILAKQLSLIREELRITTQRVNLFEKVKIPETKENIRKIRIVLGDLQTAAVVTGKIAKNKIQRKLEAGVTV